MFKVYLFNSKITKWQSHFSNVSGLFNTILEYQLNSFRGAQLLIPAIVTISHLYYSNCTSDYKHYICSRGSMP